MQIGVTGATGFIGSRVEAEGITRGYKIVRYSRYPAPKTRLFSPHITPNLEGIDALIHLAGEPLMGLWTTEKKRCIYESRILGTRRLVEAIAARERKPAVLISASAIGYYGHVGERLVEETSTAGTGFLSGVCRDWEAEALRAAALGVRVILLRTGLVLGCGGGALQRIQPFFQWGLGGRLGNGHQWMSGVHIDDIVNFIFWALEKETLHGPCNIVMPEPFRNKEFTQELARRVHRPAIFPISAFLLQFFLGDLSHLLLDSIRAVPQRALQEGYTFRFPTLPTALADVIKTEK